MKTNSKVFTQVYETNDYSLFKIIKGNRDLNEVNLSRLKESFALKYLTSIVVVNENYEIIDGQHRFKAAKELGLPIRFIICDGYGLDEVQILNQNGTDWKKKDYLKAWCDLGNQEYIKLNQFMQKYPLLNLNSAECLLTNKVNGSNHSGKGAKIDGKNVGRELAFKNGGFKVADYKKACENADKILTFRNCGFQHFNDLKFVKAMVTLFQKNVYDHDLMLKKIQLQPNSLKKCVKAKDYQILLEEIYNYRNQKKVSFHFDKYLDEM